MKHDQVLDMEPTVQAWADFVLEEWKRKATAMGISNTNALINSFKNHVNWHAGGDLQKIEFMFLYYGKFVDMGVGGGVNLSNRDAMISNDMTRRRPKQWFTDTFYRQVARLRHIISERTAQNIQFMIIRNLEDGSDLHGEEDIQAIK